MPLDPLTFVAALASGRTCVSVDHEGEARLTLVLSQPEAARLVARLDELMDRSFIVAIQPVND